MPLRRALLLIVLGLAVGLVAPTVHAQIEALPRPDTAHTASFGVSVAVGDSIAVVGTSGEPVCGKNAGAVYVYERQPGPVVTSWAISGTLVPQSCRPNSFFGEEVALNGDRVLVSASSEHFAGEGENAAYVFEQAASGRWQQTARLTGDASRQEGYFAADVALDGNRAAVSTSGDAEGAYGGAVYVFEHDATSGTWNRTARLTSPHGVETGILGDAVALDGSYLAVAASTYLAREPGAVYVFHRDPATENWHEAALLEDIDAFFIALDLSGTVLLVGEERAGTNGSGEATVYTQTDSTWVQTATLRPSIPYESGGFGAVVSLEGRRALISGYDEQLGKDINIDRVVYVFRREDKTRWREQNILDIGEVDFGAALDQHGQTAIISSVPEYEPGTAYVLQLP